MKFRLFLLLCLVLSFAPVYTDKLKLITVLYNEQNIGRLKEYITCIESNLAHPAIDETHVIYDTEKDNGNNMLHEYLIQKNISITYVKGRPSFIYCFRLANEIFPNSKVMVSNADIFFNETLNKLESYNLVGKFLALTRKEVAADGSISYMRSSGAYIGRREGSQDVWIFETPVPLFAREDIKLGTLHCEGEVAYQMMQLGLKVINPFFSIDCFHLHLSGIRHYADRPIPWPYFVELPLSELPQN